MAAVRVPRGLISRNNDVPGTRAHVPVSVAPCHLNGPQYRAHIVRAALRTVCFDPPHFIKKLNIEDGFRGVLLAYAEDVVVVVRVLLVGNELAIFALERHELGEGLMGVHCAQPFVRVLGLDERHSIDPVARVEALGLFRNVPDDVGVSLVPIDDGGPVQVVCSRFLFRPVHKLVFGHEHDVRDNAASLQCLNNRVEVLKVEEVQRHLVGRGPRRHAGAHPVLWRSIVPRRVVDVEVEHDLVEPSGRERIQEVLQRHWGDVSLQAERVQPVALQTDGEVPRPILPHKVVRMRRIHQETTVGTSVGCRATDEGATLFERRGGGSP
mmetsp:Transcript_8501/g.21819  ORF Transcript_8501/g.21819 Transcript_8501/m.21819 type:complete len:324 (-) Transcript_8501:348-1319(-)